MVFAFMVNVSRHPKGDDNISTSATAEGEGEVEGDEGVAGEGETEAEGEVDVDGEGDSMYERVEGNGRYPRMRREG